MLLSDYSIVVYAEDCVTPPASNVVSLSAGKSYALTLK